MIEVNQNEMKEIKAFLKKNKRDSIPAKEFNAIVFSKSKNKKRIRKEYFFVFYVKKISEMKYLFVLEGKHESNNTINGWLSLGKRMKYFNAIKEAARVYSLTKRKEYLNIRPDVPFKKATIKPIAYNPKSRDDDGCDRTLKIFRDLLTTYGFIKDDSREYLKQENTDEVITKEYKIEIILESQED